MNHWMDVFKRMGALWIHDGNLERPHALLTSGKHSNGFFNGSKIIKHPRVLAEACHDLLQISHAAQFAPRSVFGSAMGAVTIAHELARQMGVELGFTEPVETRETLDIVRKHMILKRFSVVQNEKVIVAEDVMTTGGTTRKTIKALSDAGADVLGTVLVLVNRSGQEFLDGRRIVTLIDHPMPIWEAEECPLCAQGSEPIRPKGRESWQELVAN
jgi:orotate phosphoribosyltransferase